MNYPQPAFFYRRRKTREITVGQVRIGGANPIVRQSMLTCDTMDTDACVQQTMDLVKVGCQIVRITAPTVKDAANLKNIREELNRRGVAVPLVADIHFKPEAAMEAAQWVEKVRINPGNFIDKKKFVVKEYTDEVYAEEVGRLEGAFRPLVELCKRRGIAMRIGTNHGSLSDRIMNRFGDTPLGMVESALEFARIARHYDFHNFLFSMKASNPKVMIEAYRLLVTKLEAEGQDWNYPIHTGVTEAGEGEDGRIKSAIGIGTLLQEGVGDTIRVSLTEDSPHEIPVCEALIEQIPVLSKNAMDVTHLNIVEKRDPFHFTRRSTHVVEQEGTRFGGEELVRVVVPQQVWDKVAPRIKPGDDVKPEGIYEKLDIVELSPLEEFEKPAEGQLVTVADGVELNPIAAFRLLAARLDQIGATNPILLKDTLEVSQEKPDPVKALLAASTTLGALLCDGIGDAILVRREPGAGASLRLAYNVLQAAGCRSFKTDYVACPSCGRTLFNLQTVTARIKSRTDHLKGVKIAIMGCIVNGPGEMADADFGYVGGAPGKINLYVGKTPVKFNIPEAEAVDRLVDLIREHGKWQEPLEKQEVTNV
ncbi:MAG: (E)-4-hydroxy-3-methylbut-2-enyl-diphosphate synthase [Verrucomicrobiae bacterium]|nr:(E)-4-hydroxy-3-methylbut-2-enyl-diphosphate synthase [Verrucomicrobiae bacterium]